MGGMGSGRWLRGSRRRLVTEHERLDVRQMARDGWLLPGTIVTLLGLRMRRRLTFQVDGMEVDEDGKVDVINLTWRPCHLGGQRPVMHCPQCSRAVYLLYRRRQWACRQCAQLAYGSQRDSATLRMIDRANRMRRKLDPENCLMLPMPPKPARMHQVTYERCVRRIMALETGLVPALEAEARSLRGALGLDNLS